MIDNYSTGARVREFSASFKKEECTEIAPFAIINIAIHQNADHQPVCLQTSKINFITL